MKTILRKLKLGLCASALFFVALPAQAVVIELTPSDVISSTGEMVALDLRISGLGDFSALSLGDYDINIAFDTSRLGLTGWTLSNMLGDIGAFEAADFSFGDLGGGLLNLSVVSLLSIPELNALQPGAFTLASIMFNVLDLEPGNATTVSVERIFALGDQGGFPLRIDDINNATIRNPGMQVPEPGTLSLLGLGLIALGWRRRRGLRL